MEFPNKIMFNRDDTVAELKEIITKQKRVANGYVDVETGEAIYEYVQAKYFLGSTLTLTKERVSEMVFKNIITTL